MTDGYWRIRQYSPGHKTGVTVTTIPLDGTVPHQAFQDHGLVFRYPDGTEEHYPWASIVKAEYQPPTNPQ